MGILEAYRALRTLTEPTSNNSSSVDSFRKKENICEKNITKKVLFRETMGTFSNLFTLLLVVASGEQDCFFTFQIFDIHSLATAFLCDVGSLSIQNGQLSCPSVVNSTSTCTVSLCEK